MFFVRFFLAKKKNKGRCTVAPERQRHQLVPLVPVVSKIAGSSPPTEGYTVFHHGVWEGFATSDFHVALKLERSCKSRFSRKKQGFWSRVKNQSEKTSQLILAFFE